MPWIPFLRNFSLPLKPDDDIADDVHIVLAWYFELDQNSDLESSI